MRVLLDTNVILDLLLERAAWFAEAREIARMDAAGRLRMYACASSITDIFYISRKLVGSEKARGIVRACIDRFRLIDVTGDRLDAAERRNGIDFEDDLQIECALDAWLDAIVTRDPKGFAVSPVTVLSPAELLARLSNGNGTQ